MTDAAKPPLNLLGAQSFRFPSFAAYADAVAAARPAVNVAPLIGHTTLRFATMDDLSRAATAGERARMAALLDDCMADGALGLSSGLFYEEAHAAPADEVTDLARVVARHGGVYTTHLRSEMAQIIEALHEAGDCAFEAGVPLVISHHKCAGPANWGRTRETLPLIDALGARQAIAMDVYPYVAGSTVLREDLVDGVIDVLLTWSDAHPGGDRPPARRRGRRVGRRPEDGLPPPDARRRLLLPDGRGRRRARDRAPAHDDRHRRPAARPPPAPAPVGRVPARASPATGASASCSRWSRRCTR